MKLRIALLLAAGVSACTDKPDEAATSAPAGKAGSQLAGFLKAHGSDLDACFNGAPDMRGPGATAVAPGTPARAVPVNRLVVAIDSSGSMAAKVGGVAKLDAAKRAAAGFLNGVPTGTQIGLVAFGHRGTNRPDGKAASCAAVETLYPLGTADRARIDAAMQGFRPAGWTPLAAAITTAGKSFTTSEQPGDQVVYVVSDGIETCGGDPVAAASALHAGAVKAIVNVIGFDLGAADRAQLKAVADAGGGTFVETTASELARMLDEVRRQAGLVTAITRERLDAGRRTADNSVAAGRFVTRMNMCMYRGITAESVALPRAAVSPEEREALREALVGRHEAYQAHSKQIADRVEAARAAANTSIDTQLEGSEVRLEQR
ncbi:vWA domain-containing protein [Glacieibacterium frigidum]|uniref:VWA domain-containing protein n=1 Tax=Glacieibacterium frigidum TaxID=2593303 RepID=A0A552UFK7_9SPHN|nr:VWA domain-containing protein [Glacieibacterium frigidum]TRW17002.1 VWA domain-containing protein [Glacieibacterium frigidum]